MNIQDLIRAHQITTGLIIEAELNGFDHTREILINELGKIDKEIAAYFKRPQGKAEFV